MIRKKWKLCLVTGLASTLTFVTVSCSSPKENIVQNITLFSTNDLHGRIIKDETQRIAGFQSIAGYLSQQSTKDLILDAGDLIQGTALNDIDKGLTMAKIANEIGYDAITVGNHEFDFGLDNLLSINNSIGNKYLSANIKTKDKNKQIFKSSIVKTLRNDLKVGIIGLTTPDTITTTHPQNVATLNFENYISTARNEIDKLEKENINFIIILSHNDRSASIPLAEELGDKIDLIIDGHSHEQYYEQIKNTHIIQSGEYTKWLRKSVLDFDKKSGKIKNFQTSLLDYATIGNNEFFASNEINNWIDDLKKQEETLFSQEVGLSPIQLLADRKYLRRMETNMGNFCCDALYKKAKEVVPDLDFALINSGGIRSTIKQGIVTRKDIYNVFPFGNKMTVIKLLGSNLKKAFDHSISKIGEGAMLQLSKEASINLNTLEYRVNNELIQDDKEYKIVTNDFLCVGGDGYEWFDPKKYNTTSIIQEFGDQLAYLEEYFVYVLKNDLWKNYAEEIPEKPQRLIGFNK